MSLPFASLPDSSEELSLLIRRTGLYRTLVIEIIKMKLAEEVEAPSREDVYSHLLAIYGTQFTSDSLSAIASQQLLGPDSFVDCIANSLRFKRWCMSRYETQLPSLFIEFKRDLTLIKYSVIRVSDCDLSWELYYRLAASEESFSDIASRYSLGSEKGVGGCLDWHHGDSLPPVVADDLMSMIPGDILRPVEIDGFWCLLRLDSRVDPVLDSETSLTLVEKKGLQYVSELYQRAVRQSVCQSEHRE